MTESTFEINVEVDGGFLRVFASRDESMRERAHLLSATLANWLKQHREVKMTAVLPISREGTTVELHAWFEKRGRSQMTEAFKLLGRITTYTYQITDLQGNAKLIKVSNNDGTGLELPDGECTTAENEDDGRGSATLRETIGPDGQIEKAPSPHSNNALRRTTTVYDEHGRIISRVQDF